MKKISLLLLLLTNQYAIIAQSVQFTEGTVFSINNYGKKETIIGASVRWANANTGGITDTDGYFKIQKKPENHELIISMSGYKTDSLMVHHNKTLSIQLEEAIGALAVVEIRGNATVIDKLNPIQNEMLTIKTLKKAACCNLSESFETNGTISVNYADAITGIKQIQMLGLSGNYVQINTENIPNIRGLKSTYGLSFIPGTWINSINIGKGLGSVVNGYEAINGVMNIELIAPENSNKYMLNTYQNSIGRSEFNFIYADTLNNHWGTTLLAHSSGQLFKTDNNHDDFLDTPLYKQLNIFNNWKYHNEKISALFGAKYLIDNRIGGQTQFNEQTDRGTFYAYGFGSRTQRAEAYGKFALLFPDKPYKGLGIILNAVNHENNSFFGFKNYSGLQKSLYGNLIFQNIIGNTNHTYKAGLSFLADNYRESFQDTLFTRNELVPGLFYEYNYTIPQKLSLLIGLREDFHNLYGNKFSPRIHLKYDVTSDLTLRLNAGRGWRVPNALAENFAILVNTRSVSFKDKILPEVADNYGFSLTKEFVNSVGKGNFVADYYYTNFQNQLVVDMEYHHATVFYNQPGISFAKTYQLEANFNTFNRLDIKIAYRNSHVISSYYGENDVIFKTERQFVVRNRILFNTAYATKWDKWKFDFTWQWNGKSRVPIFDHAKIGILETTWSPSFSNINAQVTKKFKKFEVYLGGENIGNFKQDNPIIDSKNPFGISFDASMVWGPIIGRITYLGLRWNIEK